MQMSEAVLPKACYVFPILMKWVWCMSPRRRRGQMRITRFWHDHVHIQVIWWQMSAKWVY